MVFCRFLNLFLSYVLKIGSGGQISVENVESMCILKIKVSRLHKNHGVLAWFLLSSEHAASRMYLFKIFVFYSKIQGFLARGGGHISVEKLLNFSRFFSKKV